MFKGIKFIIKLIFVVVFFLGVFFVIQQCKIMSLKVDFNQAIVDGKTDEAEGILNEIKEYSGFDISKKLDSNFDLVQELETAKSYAEMVASYTSGNYEKALGFISQLKGYRDTKEYAYKIGKGLLNKGVTDKAKEALKGLKGYKDVDELLKKLE